MSTPLSYTIVAGGNNATPSAFSFTIAASGVAQPINIGHNQLIRVVSTAPVYIRFGPTTLTTATASDVYLPANVIELYDMGRQNENIAVFNGGASSAIVNITIVSRT